MELQSCFTRPASQFPARAILNGSWLKPWKVAYRARPAMAVQQAASGATATRRSANFQPNLWDYDSVQSLSIDSLGETDAQQVERLKKEVKGLIYLYKDEALVSQLELLDDIEHLGLGYHFKNEIAEALGSFWRNDSIKSLKDDLYATSLAFRLLRSHGFKTSEVIFDSFKDDNGNLKSAFRTDVEAILSLYEASYLAVEGETKLDEARDFATKQLKDLKPQLESHLKQKVEYALEFPLQWRATRFEARRFIEEYENSAKVKPVLLQLAKLDFNLVQTIQQNELKRTIRWWKESGVSEKLSFARDRLMECFFFATGIIAEPQYGFAREEIAKAFKLITVIDDVYDVYGTLDELEIFTSAVNRWDMSAVKDLPEYMRICYSTLINTVNAAAEKIKEQQNWDALPFLKKSWVDLLNAFLVEAKWSNRSYVPKLDEYLNNARISVSGHVLLYHALLCSGEKPSEEVLECLNEYTELILSSSKIFRLCNDLATSKEELERGDVATSIQCYMNDNEVSEAAARDGVKKLIMDTWKQVNSNAADCGPFPQSFGKAAINLGRISHLTYHRGDGHGAPDEEKKMQIKLLFFEPLPLKEGKIAPDMATAV